MEESIKHGTALLETMRNWKKCCNLKYSFSLKYLTQIFSEFCKYTSFPVAQICGWVVSWREQETSPPLLPLFGHSSGTLQILKQLGAWKKIWRVQVFGSSRSGISRRDKLYWTRIRDKRGPRVAKPPYGHGHDTKSWNTDCGLCFKHWGYFHNSWRLRSFLRKSK